MIDEQFVERAAVEILRVEGFVVSLPLSEAGRGNTRWLSALAKARAVLKLVQATAPQQQSSPSSQ